MMGTTKNYQGVFSAPHRQADISNSSIIPFLRLTGRTPGSLSRFKLLPVQARSRQDRSHIAAATSTENEREIVSHAASSQNRQDNVNISLIHQSNPAVLVHGQVTIIFVVSVCLFVCAEFFSAVFDPILIKLGHMLYVWV